MKRTLKNILALVLIILCGCSMLLTMTKIKEGSSLVDWMIEMKANWTTNNKDGDHIVTPQPDSETKTEETVPDDAAQSQLKPAEDPQTDSDPDPKMELPEATAEHPRTEARRIEIYPVQFNEQPADTTANPDTPAKDAQDQEIPEVIAPAPVLPENPNDSFMVYEKKDGTLYIFGVNWKDAAAFAIESLILAMTLWYLLLSGLNKKTFQQTLGNADKFWIWFLCTILTTTALTAGNGWIAQKYFLPRSSSADLIPEIPAEEQQKPQDDPALEQIEPAGPEYQAALKLDADTVLDYGEYTSKKPDEIAVWADGSSAAMKGGKVDKTGNTTQEQEASQYGINAAILASNGADLTLSDMTVETNGKGASGVFSYGTKEGTPSKVVLSKSTITTSADDSSALMTAGGADLQASDLNVSTYGQASSAIRTDQGGGTVDITDGTYTTYGAGSPVIYSTADVQAANATLTSNVSEGIIVEGANRVFLKGCTLKDTNTTLHGLSDSYKNIFLYQEAADASDGTAWFEAEDSTITTGNGDTFYLTNTEAKITLKNNTMENLDPAGSLLRLASGPWGTEGRNGAFATVTFNNQKVDGDIHVDALSELYLNIDDGSTYSGAINNEKTARKVYVTLTKDSHVKLTGDWYIDKLTNEDKQWNNVDYNGYTIYVAGKGWNAHNSK